MLLLFPLLLLLTLGLLLFLFCGLGLLLLLFRLSLLLLFLGLSLLFVFIFLSVRGGNGSEKKEQNSRADKSNWFHDCYLLWRFHAPLARHAGRGCCFRCLSPVDDMRIFPLSVIRVHLRPNVDA